MENGESNAKELETVVPGLKVAVEVSLSWDFRGQSCRTNEDTVAVKKLKSASGGIVIFEELKET